MSTSEVSAPILLQPKPIEKTPRIEWVDAAKGIGIILVVLGHAIVGLRDSALASPDSILIYIHYLIYSFHMPLFFFLSGIFIAKRVAGGALTFSKSSTIKLGKAYIIWLPIQMLMLVLAGSLANKPLNGHILNFVSILWEPKYNFWFIYALLLMNILSAIVLPKMGAGVMMVLCILLYSLAQWMKLPAMLWGLFWFAPYYALGIVFGINPIKFKMGRPALATAGIAFTAAWLYIAQQLHQQGIRLWAISTFATAATGGMATLLWVGASGKRITNVLSYFGKESLTIYLVHVIFTAGTRIIMDKFLHITSIYTILVFATCIGVAGPLLIKKLADRLRISNHLGLA